MCAQSQLFKISQVVLVSLSTLMYELKVGELASILTGLEAMIRSIPEDQRDASLFSLEVRSILDRLSYYGDRLELDPSLRLQVQQLGSQIAGIAAISGSALKARLETIQAGLINNLQSRLVMVIPVSRAKHFTGPELFTDSVFMFPDATSEIADAGRCYAANLPTACVFHSMRISEHGLRALAKRLQIKLSAKGKECPIEYADWAKVIDAIENKIEKVRQKPVGAKKNSELIFYSEAAMHCTRIKDIWRNEVSHTRTRYNLTEALAAMSRVADFMQLLAMGLYTSDERIRMNLEAMRLSLNTPKRLN